MLSSTGDSLRIFLAVGHFNPTLKFSQEPWRTSRVMKLKKSGWHKKPSFAKSAIKARLDQTKNDALFGRQPLTRGSSEHKALKKVFKEEKKKGTYSRKAFKNKNNA